MSLEISDMNLIRLAAYTDIHLNLKDPAASILFKSHRLRVPAELMGVMTALAEQVKIHAEQMAIELGSENKSFMVDLGKVRFRTTAIRPGELYAMRQSRQQAPILGKDVILSDHVSAALLSEDLKRSGGLVIINGIPGSGKTWTALATILKRLELHGGYCLTIEDPPEMLVEGWIGEKGGLCEQMDASRTGYREAVATSLRCFPAQERAMMFIGEIREPEPAAEMLRIALGGHLVFTTVHAEDHAAACQRIVSLAQMGGEPDAKRMLANSLRLSLNQRLDGTRMNASILKSSKEVAGSIEKGEYAQFSNIVLSQEKAMTGRPGMSLPRPTNLPGM